MSSFKFPGDGVEFGTSEQLEESLKGRHRGWTFSKRTIRLSDSVSCRDQRCTNNSLSLPPRLHCAAATAVNHTRLIVCLGLSGAQTLGWIEQSGHPVSGRAARGTPGKERAVGTGLKILRSTQGGAQHED